MIAPIAAAATGSYRGRLIDDVVAWRGVRYAEAPRFRAPVPVPDSSAEVDSVDPGPTAWQPVGDDPAGRALATRLDEDCLRVQIWAPAGARDAAVLVWIHGGGFIGGDPSGADADGADLARATGLVVVNVGYRVGPLGFLDLRAQVPGADTNVGLRDLIAALTWVSRNIAAFGGDPARVTLGGQSAGAGCITALLAMPAAAGLFAGAIAQSSPVRTVVDGPTATSIAARYERLLAPEAAADLERADPAALVAPVARLLAEVAAGHPGTLACAPLVGDEVLPTSPLDAARAGSTHPVPTLVGWNRDEASAFRGSDAIVVHREALETWVGVERLLARFPGYPAADAVEAAATDLWFGEPTRAFAAAQATRAPTWVSRFDRAPAGLRTAGLGATHGIEAGYLFGNFGRGMWPWIAPDGPDADDLATLETVRATWRSMAEHARPGADWPTYDDRRVRRIAGSAVETFRQEPDEAESP